MLSSTVLPSSKNGRASGEEEWGGRVLSSTVLVLLKKGRASGEEEWGGRVLSSTVLVSSKKGRTWVLLEWTPVGYTRWRREDEALEEVGLSREDGPWGHD